MTDEIDYGPETNLRLLNAYRDYYTDLLAAATDVRDAWDAMRGTGPLEWAPLFLRMEETVKRLEQELEEALQ